MRAVHDLLKVPTGAAPMKKLLASSALVFGVVAGIATVITVTPQPATADTGCSGCVVDQSPMKKNDGARRF